MSEIRVTYAGLIAFSIKLVSVITGLIFTLIVTRELTQAEFGTWGLIGSLLAYVMILDPIISYWTTREIARGKDLGKTALFSNSLLSISGILIYIVISKIVGTQSDADTNILIFASMLVPVIFINNTLNAINLGWKPQNVSYGFLSFEIVKIPSAFVFVYILQFGIEGAIIATFIAYLCSIITLIILGRKKIHEKLNYKFIKKCFRFFWIPTYRDIPALLFNSDILIFSVITGSVVGVAFYSVSRALSSLVMHTDSFASALYPKLLAGGKREYLQENLLRFFYFAIPMVALSISIAKPGLFALNPAYEPAFLIVIIMTFRAFLSTINKMFFSALHGIEKIDSKENENFKNYVKSKLFWLPTIRFIQYGTYVILLITVLSIFSGFSTQLELVMIWAIIAMLIEIPFLIYLLNLVKKDFALKIDKKSLFKYIGVSLGTFGTMYYFIEKFLDYNVSIFEFLPDLIIYILFGVFSYVLITYLVDSRTKKLFKAIFNEIKR